MNTGAPLPSVIPGFVFALLRADVCAVVPHAIGSVHMPPGRSTTVCGRSTDVGPHIDGHSPFGGLHEVEGNALLL